MVQYRIKSKFLNSITNFTKKLSLTEDGVKATSPALDDDGNFISEIETDKEINFFNPDVDVEKKEEPKTKEELVSQASEKLRNALDIASELDEIIQQIKQSEKEEDDQWKVNDDHTDVYLSSKDAHIFQQNGNILLSHDGKIEVFKTVQELHNWLKENNYPLPPSIEIHESTDEQILKILED